MGRWLEVLPSGRVSGLARHRDVHRQPGAGAGDSGQLPAAEDPRDGTAAVRNCLPRAKRQFVNAVGGHVVANVDVGAAAVAGAAGHVLEDTDSPEPMEASVIPWDHM